MDLSAILRPPEKNEKPTPLFCLGPERLAAFTKKLAPGQRAYLTKLGFAAKAGDFLALPGEDGISAVLFGLGEGGERNPFLPGKLASLLPPGSYKFAGPLKDPELAHLAFVLESYRFQKYKAPRRGKVATLLWADRKALAEAHLIAESVVLARDLINTPANDMGPDELTAAIKKLGNEFGARVTVTSGKALQNGFPLVYAVGQGSARAPRLVDFSWGKASHPKVTLVGKGVVFDTGGLDIKSPSNMLLMKKDMGGAACVLALARMIMGAGLKIRLRVIVPIVENAVSGASYRPSDVFKSRKGISVEIGDTDAEGRLILADALTFADEEKPDLLIDMATLTGAARVALGPDLPPFYTRDDKLARELQGAAARQFDPLWRMPLWQPYARMLESKTADISNITGSSHAGSITAALFLSKFVSARSWVHFDVFAWNPSSRPGKPEGGEAQGVRALFALLKNRYKLKR